VSYWRRLIADPERAGRVLGAVFEGSHDGMFVTDAEGTFIDLNAAACELFGLPKEDLVNRRGAEFRAPETDIAWLQAILAVEGRLQKEVVLVRKDGSRRRVEVSVTGNVLPGFHLVVLRDVTERRAAEEELRENAARLEEAQRISHFGSWQRDLETNRSIWSKELYRIFGLDQPDCPPSFEDFLAFIHPDDRERVRSVLAAAEADPQPLDVEFRIVRQDGSTRIIHGRGQVVVDAGARKRLVGIAQDITEQKVTEQRLALAERMASLGALAGGVAHEINNPLTYVLGNLKEIIRELQASSEPFPLDRQRQLLARVEQAYEGTDRVRRIAGDLRTFSRGGDEEATPVDVRSVLEFSVKVAWGEIRHRARVVRDYGEVPPVLGTEHRLGQVFVNLLVNAAQSIAEGHALKNEIRVRTRVAAKNQVVIEIEDTGSGIAPSIVESIFDPFVTTKPVGSGLGLSICDSIVKGFGGTIEVESEVGRGSTFRVILPRATDQPRRHVPEEAPAPMGRCRVLIVDDEPRVAATLRMLLETEHDVEVAAGGAEALHRLSSGGRFDVIFCDLMMPDVTGMDLYAELASTAPDQAARIVFMTGGAYTIRANEFLASVPNTQIEKPFDIELIESLMRRALPEELRTGTEQSEPRASIL
jgi:PAS domain S-box-containing protein